MSLRSLTYTSLAGLDLDSDDLLAIHTAARQLNALDGITGLLIHNGTHFLQIIEGPDDAIGDLVERLRRDPRHTGFEVRDDREVEERSFAGWTMELARVRSRYFEAREDLMEVLPPDLPAPVHDRVLRMTELISGTVDLG
ncbi:BLUF domain-containing protein [Sphingomonas sp. BN140010]|uniref:BLUF domain-containing protein n=1 Tax=Sphingomonas arvum TaxID=2992113 RepID=A0ABT3JD27_9SPHN|nr:BLUF domain-containing protein [Sphingomonas sp. BN140010]MCW3796970.1 BLUF domain-containing protein [Sphingomonas sp. BN140010]